MKKLFILLLLISVKVCAQNKTQPFKVLIEEVKGDLYKDGLPDLVKLTQDTLVDEAPYRLQVFFAQPGGKWKLIVSSDQIIAPQFPNGKDGYRGEASFESLTIKNNVLTISNQLIRGNFAHKFRYQNGNFELIGFTQVNANGLGEMHKEDFNLSTGIRYYKEERYDTNEIIVNKKEKKLIRPLPKLQSFVPFEKDF